MLERLLIAGSGGQGIVLIGRLLATVAVRRVEHVTFFPSYGAEVRGGTSSCQVVLSSRQIASPLSEEFDSMVVMNEASADKFREQMRPGCLVVMNTPLRREIPGVDPLYVDATRMADELGDARIANFVVLGCYVGRKPLVAPEEIEREMEQVLSGKTRSLVDLNIQAFRAGLALA